ncbi:hypothetical protein NDU88_003962 [Pleurodeles waltl]|uniref:Uncharacterized protein n=1 Tax=Pleurodeles waltl TaxID=8319 RepID=A0AAV7LIJ1_PLEWA|nr:hypothetical protein NDU88_003962 [Pleurodeles waltl]
MAVGHAHFRRSSATVQYVALLHAVFLVSGTRWRHIAARKRQHERAAARPLPPRALAVTPPRASLSKSGPREGNASSPGGGGMWQALTRRAKVPGGISGSKIAQPRHLLAPM